MKKHWYKKVMSAVQLPTFTLGASAIPFSAAHADIDQALLSELSNRQAALLNNRTILPNTLNATSKDLYAGHRSHSSHSSHRSSSGGGYRSSPVPKYSVPRTPSFPSTPSVVPDTTPTPKAQRPATTSVAPTPQDVSQMVVRVQAALMRRGYFNGDIDGILGPQTRSALKKFQKDQKISQTGRMDIETLTHLGIQLP